MLENTVSERACRFFLCYIKAKESYNLKYTFLIFFLFRDVVSTEIKNKNSWLFLIFKPWDSPSQHFRLVHRLQTGFKNVFKRNNYLYRYILVERIFNILGIVHNNALILYKFYNISPQDSRSWSPRRNTPQNTHTAVLLSNL